MLTSLFFLDNYGSVLLEKHFEEHVPRSLCTRFWEEVNSFRSPLEVPPVMQVANVFVFSLFKPVNATKDSASLILNTIKQTEDSSGHISAWGTGFGKATSGLWIISASNVEVQPLSVLDLLDSVYTMLERYLGQGFSSHALVENASTVMLLLDEMFDAGLPYTSESNQLTEMIDIPDMAHQLIASVSGKKSVSEKLPKSISSPYPWRKSGAKYLSNEIFIDVEEFLDVSFAPSGEVSSSFIYGKVHCTCLLSSNPELTLKIKSPEIVQNGGFHRCARVNNLSVNLLFSR